MVNNRAFGKALGSLDVAIVDNKRGMITVLRALLSSFGFCQIRCFEDPEGALAELRSEPADVVITRDRLMPIDGADFVRQLRQKHMGPACFSAVIMLSAMPNRRILDAALRSGAHKLLCLPISARDLHQRITWLTLDDRHLVLEKGRYVIEGVEELLQAAATDPCDRSGRHAASAIQPPTPGNEPGDEDGEAVWEL